MSVIAQVFIDLTNAGIREGDAFLVTDLFVVLCSLQKVCQCFRQSLHFQMRFTDAATREGLTLQIIDLFGNIQCLFHQTQRLLIVAHFLVHQRQIDECIGATGGILAALHCQRLLVVVDGFFVIADFSLHLAKVVNRLGHADAVFQFGADRHGLGVMFVRLVIQAFFPVIGAQKIVCVANPLVVAGLLCCEQAGLERVLCLRQIPQLQMGKTNIQQSDRLRLGVF